MTSHEYIKIRSWLWRNEPNNSAIQEIDNLVHHKYSKNPDLCQFTEGSKLTIQKVRDIINSEILKQKEISKLATKRKRK